MTFSDTLMYISWSFIQSIEATNHGFMITFMTFWRPKRCCFDSKDLKILKKLHLIIYN